MLLPHVSILTHACNQCSENVYVCFHDSDMVIDSMVASGQLKEDLRNKVREAMLKKHHHQNERKLSNRIPLVRSFADIGKKHSDPLLLERNGETLNMHSHFLFLPVFDRWGTVVKKKNHKTFKSLCASKGGKGQMLPKCNTCSPNGREIWVRRFVLACVAESFYFSGLQKSNCTCSRSLSALCDLSLLR